jgi:hypothetical protein
MADGEHRMLFDIRGRRKHVVRFVYAILALLMGASLFLVVGPVNIAGIFGGETSNSAANQFEDQAERIQHRLKKDPENPDLLLSLTRAQVNSGNALAETIPASGAVIYTPESRLKIEEASETWAKYLKATDEPSSSGAQLIAQAQFGLAQRARTGPEALSNVIAAAKAQQIVAEVQPSIGSYSSLAIFRYFSFDFAGAEEARKKAMGFAKTKFERESLENELDTFEKRGHLFQKQLVKAEKEAKKAREQGAPGVANPLGETGSGSLGE